MRRRSALLWIAFLTAHLLVAWLGWVYPSQPMGDVVLVYEPWSSAVLGGGAVVGITEEWVYPQLALLPMVLVRLLAAPLAPILGLTDAYLIGWAVFVTALDAIGFRVLLGRSPSRARRSAGWFWVAALTLLGPIALYRIDAVAVPLAVVAAVMLARRPAVGAALLAIGAWIKIWPGALLLAAGIAARQRMRVLLAGAVTAVGVLVVVILVGSAHPLGFLTEQTGRGLQIEAVAATPYLWMALQGAASIDYSFEILTFQIEAPGVEIVASLLTPLMVVVVAAITAIAVVKAARSASVQRLLPSLALALVAALIVTNKVGSPQFQTWLIAPVVLWMLRDRRRAVMPALVVLLLCVLTCLIYPLTYDALLAAQPLPIALLSLRNTGLVVLLGLSIRSLILVPASSDRSRTHHWR